MTPPQFFVCLFLFGNDLQKLTNSKQKSPKFAPWETGPPFPLVSKFVAIFFHREHVGKKYTSSSHANPSWDFSSLQPAAFHAVEASEGHRVFFSLKAASALDGCLVVFWWVEKLVAWVFGGRWVVWFVCCCFSLIVSEMVRLNTVGWYGDIGLTCVWFFVFESPWPWWV